MGFQVITTTGGNTWNWPSGVTQAIAEGIGAGGAGGGALGNPSTGGGGKGGGYAKKTITKGAESSLTVTVGAGGVATGGNSEVQQGATVVMLAPGGAAASGAAANSQNGNPAVSHPSTAIGDVTYDGGNGGTGNFTSGVGGSGAGGGAAGPAGVGGNASGNTPGAANRDIPFQNGTHYGGSGATGVGNSTAGAAGSTYGGAGSGGKANNNTDRAGGSGANGIVVISYPGSDGNLNIDAYRFFEDNSATQSSLTGLGAGQDIAYSLDLTSGVDKDFLLRLEVYDSLAISSYGTRDMYTLQCSKNSGAWNSIGSGQVVEPVLSPNYAEGGLTNTSLLTVPFASSQLNVTFSEDGTIGPIQADGGGTFSHEFMYSIRVKQSLLANGDVITFRLLRDKEGLGIATQVHTGTTPTLNIVKSGGGPAQNSNFLAFF